MEWSSTVVDPEPASAPAADAPAASALRDWKAGRLAAVSDEQLAAAVAAAADGPGGCPTELVDALEARGAALVGVVNTAAAGLVEVIAQALACDAWVGYGIASPEHWVALRFGLSAHRARRYVATARALAALPAIRDAYGRGEVGEDHVAAVVTAGVQPCHDRQVAELARSTTVSQLRTALRTLPPPPITAPSNDNTAGAADGGDTADSAKAADSSDAAVDAAAAASAGPRATRVSRVWNDDGTYELHAVLPGIDGALLDKGFELGFDKLLRRQHPELADPDDDDSDLDAGGFGPGTSRGIAAAAARAQITPAEVLRYLFATAIDAMDPATATHPDRTPSPRYIVNVHLDGTTSTPDGLRATIHLGPVLPQWAIEEVTCDGTVRLWVDNTHGSVNLGDTRRVADPKLRAVIEHRDGGCATPGCYATRGLRIHHIVHWTANGPTDTHNLIALCPTHHRLVHQRLLTITGNADHGATFTTPDGRPIGATPPIPPDRPPPDAARQLGLPPPTWHNRSGERGHWDCLTWPDPPHPN